MGSDMILIGNVNLPENPLTIIIVDVEFHYRIHSFVSAQFLMLMY